MTGSVVCRYSHSGGPALADPPPAPVIGVQRPRSFSGPLSREDCREVSGEPSGNGSPSRRTIRFVTSRTWIFVVVGAILGATVGLAYVTRFDLLCVHAPVVYGGVCMHDEIFGWQPGTLAVPIWMLIGLVGGGLVGWIAAGPMTRIRWLLIGAAAAVGVVAYFAWVYTPDPGFDF
jgi:uncharacterized membrane protein YuzA (DUF378 family)